MKRISIIFLLVSEISICPCLAEFQVNQRFSDDQSKPAVATDPEGNFIIVWASHFSTTNRSNDIFARRFDLACKPITNEFQINNTTAGNQTEPSVATDASGSFIVVWQGPGTDAEDIYARWFDSNGLPLRGESPINEYTSGSQLCPHVAMDGAGNSVIVWETSGTSQNPTKQSVCARLFDSIGSSLCPEFTVDDSSYNCRYPDVTMDIAGNFFVVWVQDRTAKSIMARLYDSAGKPRTQPFEVSTIKFSSLTRPSVAMSDAGYFVVTWDGDPKLASLDDIHARLYDPNGKPLTDQFTVNTTLTGAQQYPQVVVNHTGDFVIVWQSDSETSGTDIFAQRFNRLGQAIGGEFPINTYTQNDQQYPAVAISETGCFFAAWQSNGQDGSGWGVFAEVGHFADSADLNRDGTVNFLDFAILAKEWLTTSPTTDLITDSVINALDLSTLFDCWLTLSSQ